MRDLLRSNRSLRSAEAASGLIAQVSRQQLSADWRKRLQVIQSKATQAWGSLPAHVATSLQPTDQSGSDAASADYFVACQVQPHGWLCRPTLPVQHGIAPCDAG